MYDTIIITLLEQPRTCFYVRNLEVHLLINLFYKLKSISKRNLVNLEY